MTTLCTSQCQDGNKVTVLKVYDWKCQDIKLEALENLNAQKSTSRILTSILLQYSENFELKPKCKL